MRASTYTPSVFSIEKEESKIKKQQQRQHQQKLKRNNALIHSQTHNKLTRTYTSTRQKTIKKVTYLIYHIQVYRDIIQNIPSVQNELEIHLH